MALPEIKPVTRKWAWAYMADVSADSSAYTVSPCRGRIVSARSVMYGATTAAPAAIAISINGTAVTGLSLTLAEDGAAGDVDVAYPTALSTTYVNEGDTILFDSDGGSSTTAPAMLMVEIEQD
jgi:hypothetical protein